MSSDQKTEAEVVQSCSLSSSHLATLDKGIPNILDPQKPGSLSNYCSFVKKWAGLARSANIAILYLPWKPGSLNLPSISTQHKRLQVSRQAQLLTSADVCVRHLAERELHQYLSLSRRKFKASVAVQEVMMMDPDFTRRFLSARAKGYVQASDDDDRLDNLQRLEKEGQMSRLSTPQVAEIRAKSS